MREISASPSAKPASPLSAPINHAGRTYESFYQFHEQDFHVAIDVGGHTDNKLHVSDRCGSPAVAEKDI